MTFASGAGTLPGMPIQCMCSGQPATLCTYGRTACEPACAIHAGTPAEVQARLACLPPGEHLTLRAGGNALDGQALPDEHALLLAGAFVTSIAVDAAERTVTVGAAAPWEAIVNETIKHGLVPFSVPSGSTITAGGSISSHSISRFSPTMHKEGDHVVSMDVALADGTLVTGVSPTNRPDIFGSVIAGLGFAGIVLSITHELFRVPGWQQGLPVNVASQLETLPDGFSWNTLLARLLPKSVPAGWDTSFASVWWRSLDRDRAAIVSDSRYTTDPAGPRMLIYERSNVLREAAEVLLMSRLLDSVMQDLFSLGAHHGTVFVDPIGDFLFYMDPNRKLLGLLPRVRVFQQAFCIRTQAGAAAFLDTLEAETAHASFSPALVDVLYLQADLGTYTLSPTRGQGGWVVTLTFLLPNGDHLGSIYATLAALSDACLAAGGVVHLSKAVHARRSTIDAMYPGALAEFRAAKALLDPAGRLQNAFYRSWIG